MKNKTKTTIIGLALILGLGVGATPAKADVARMIECVIQSMYNVWTWTYVTSYGDGHTVRITVEGEAPCTYQEALDYYRADPSYIGEDEDYILLKGKVNPLNANNFLNDPNGTYTIHLLKLNVLGWVNAGCPEE